MRFAFAALLALAGCHRRGPAMSDASSNDSALDSTAPDAEVDASLDAASDASDAARGIADAAPARVYVGQATWYTTDGRGTCRCPPSPEDPNVVAINKAQYPKIACGQCLQVTGPSGTVKVRVTDVCPGCERGDLDLSAQAFGAIAAPELGRVKVRWFVTPC
jgi:expansin (peptidoglycan-binding protein)